MKQQTKHTLKTLAAGCAIIIFSKPLGLCFMIVGEIIINGGDIIKNLF